MRAIAQAQGMTKAGGGSPRLTEASILVKWWGRLDHCSSSAMILHYAVLPRAWVSRFTCAMAGGEVFPRHCLIPFDGVI